MDIESPLVEGVVPGGMLFCFRLIVDRLGSVDEYEAGEGTFVQNEIIFASILGSKMVVSGSCWLLLVLFTSSW